MGDDMTPSDHDLLIRMDATLQEMKKQMNVILPQIMELQGDRTQNQVNITNLQSDVKTLEAKSDMWNTINSIGVSIAAVIAAALGFAR